MGQSTDLRLLGANGNYKVPLMITAHSKDYGSREPLLLSGCLNYFGLNLVYLPISFHNFTEVNFWPRDSHMMIVRHVFAVRSMQYKLPI